MKIDTYRHYFFENQNLIFKNFLCNNINGRI